ncbi:MAG: DUF2203 domain-containing protein [Verrucomicrobia bacterium]|nr:DUF2203 domain-containing protein [Verrucomicrobiota bacterium]
MAFQYSKHYTREEARALLPCIRQWLEQLAQLRSQLQEHDRHLGELLAQGSDAGGEPVHRWAKTLGGIKKVLGEFQKREIQIKDLDRGLIDFPAFVGGQEVFLCWEKDEEDIEYWHDLTSGYSGRERL